MFNQNHLLGGDVLKQKTCLITGGNSGIGKAAATALAQAGHRVIIGCRNRDRGMAAQNEIQHISNEERVDFLQVDMSSQTSIKSAANLLKTNYGNLDVLIHNAADFDLSRRSPVYTEDSIESVWATNHIGPVLLTNLLIDNIKSSAQGRVITVASQGLMLHPFLKIDFNDPEFRNRKFTVAKAYYQSKLAQVMYTYWLADFLKGTRVTANCIRVTNVKIDINRYPGLARTMKFFYSIKSSFSISPEAMGRTYVYLATSDDLQSITGRYFDENNRMVRSSRYSKSWENIEQLMEITTKYFRND
jgi:NAD(P)-dependent dehydrogenase (short-subunit alcohol dehydrogenase family)